MCQLDRVDECRLIVVGLDVMEENPRAETSTAEFGLATAILGPRPETFIISRYNVLVAPDISSILPFYIHLLHKLHSSRFHCPAATTPTSKERDVASYVPALSITRLLCSRIVNKPTGATCVDDIAP